MLLAVDRHQQGRAVALDANFDREGCRRRLAKREKRQGYEAGDDELKGAALLRPRSQPGRLPRRT